MKKLWRKWLPIAQAIGNFQAQVILTVFYLVIMSPLGIGFRVLKRKRIATSNFQKWEHPKESLEEARKQY